MSKEEVKPYDTYFNKSVKKVHVRTLSGVITFKEFLSHRYNGTSSYYATFALMGLKSDDVLVEGSVLGDCHHIWVEFKFENEEYVFDPMNVELMQKQTWYELFNPSVKHRTTQEKILDSYLNYEHAFKITDTTWQFGSHVLPALDAALIKLESPNSKNITEFTGYFIDPGQF